MEHMVQMSDSVPMLRTTSLKTLEKILQRSATLSPPLEAAATRLTLSKVRRYLTFDENYRFDKGSNHSSG
jgi:hypothetical protein